MLDTCFRVSLELDLQFNVKKCVAIRIGRRFNSKCQSLMLGGNGKTVALVDEIKYLGVIIKKGSVFARSYSSSKLKFYKSFNAIYGKASFASEEVLCNLLQTFCLPVVGYACEAVPPCRADVKSINRALCCAYQKISRLMTRI